MVRDFVNTTDHETGIDELTTQAELVRYLGREGLLPGSGRATADDLALARRLRAGLRARAGGEPRRRDRGPSRAGERTARAAGRARLGRRTGPTLRTTAGGVRGALAQIGLAAQEAANEGIWWRLKICSYDECEWAYYDHSKNRSRSWCEYGCGNKVKTRAYRARQKART